MLHDAFHSYLAIGTGLDPRQQVLYGRQLGPLLVGLSLGLVSCSTTGIAPGYTGASMNPTRALALAIAGRNWHHHWIWWIGPALASILIGLMYRFAPPSYAERVKHKAKVESSGQQEPRTTSV
jgi:glycerol uptake facilitator-like aquaporin